MKNTSHFVFCIILWIYTVLANGDCPLPHALTPCSCSPIKDGISVKCTGPEDANQIYSILAGITEARNWELQLESLNLTDLPQSVSSVSSLRISKCNIGHLRASVPAAWPKLHEVVIESVTMTGSPWQYLTDARRLRHLKISSFEMSTIGMEFQRGVPEGLAYLDLRKTRTTTLEPNSMSHLRNLVYLLVVDVPLKEFPRSVLPVKMPHLHTFILGNTQIEILETTFFEGMPKLEVLMLNGNKLATLDSQLFLPLGSHLTHLLAERNPLLCECNLLWLKKDLQKKQSINVMATCYDIAAQEFREVTSLDEQEYCS